METGRKIYRAIVAGVRRSIMKIYEKPSIAVVYVTKSDVVTASVYDNDVEDKDWNDLLNGVSLM